MAATLQIKASSTTTYTIQASLQGSVLDCKKTIEATAGVPVAQQRLIYAGQVLANERTLESYGIKDGHTMHMVAKASPSSPAAPSSPASASTAAPAPPVTAPNAEPLPNPFAAGGPFAGMGMGGMGGLGGSGVGEMGGLGGLGGLGANPALMAQLMADPLVQQQMHQVFSNPALLDQMLAANPMAQQMLAANPQMRELLRSPEFMRQLMNPQLIQMALGMQGAAPFAVHTPAAPAATQPGASPVPPGPAWGAFLGAMPGAMPGAPRGGADQPPEQRYAVQLQQLQDMGFQNRAVNLRALEQANGSVELALALLFDR